MNLQDLDGMAVLTIEETARLLGLSRWKVYRSVQAGELPSFSLGRRLYVPVPKLKAMLGLDEHDDSSVHESRGSLAVPPDER